MEQFIEPIIDSLRRLDNKDRTLIDPPTADDVIDVLKAINDNQQVEDLFVDAFNAAGPVLMMCIHVLAINCLLQNPDAFAQQAVRTAATENFKAEPSSQKMMQYLMDGIVMRRRTFQRSNNIWDSSLYVRSEDQRYKKNMNQCFYSP